MSTAPPSGVAVVTGGVSGLGRGIAAALARRGLPTVVVGRGAERVDAAVRAIASESGGGRVEGLPVTDLAARSEMRGLAETIVREHPDVSILVNNAGGMFSPRQTTHDGLERTFALNVLAPFVLTRAVGAQMRARAGGRIVEIASAAHRGARVPFDDLQSTRGYSGWRAYGRSKLELILLTREFGRRWSGSGVTVNAVHPGFVRSRFGQNNGRLSAGVIAFLARVGGRTIAAGADTPVYVATDPAIGAATGQYFANRATRAGSPASRDLDAAQRLYAACEQLAAG